MSLQCDNLSGELQDQWSSSCFFRAKAHLEKSSYLQDKVPGDVMRHLHGVKLVSVYLSFFYHLFYHGLRIKVLKGHRKFNSAL